MSRIGRLPVPIPDGVNVTIDGNTIVVKGPKGGLSTEFHKYISVKVENNEIIVTRSSDNKFHKSLHGLTRSLISNMVTGVTNGYEKALELSGVGYRAAKQGNKLVLTVGYSHPVEIVPSDGIEIEVPNATNIIIRGIDKQAVGQLAAKIRAVRPPEPYGGKGIKYKGEQIRRKAGKLG